MKGKEKLRFYLWTSVGYFVFMMLLELKDQETYGIRLTNTLWRMPFMIAINYIFLEFILPLFRLNWKNMIIAPIVLAIALPLFSSLLMAWRNLGIAIGTHKPLAEYTKHKEFEVMVGVVAFSWFLFGVTKFVYDYRKLRLAAQQLQIEKQAAELNYLKSQTNPHFLFNTLNNIYSLSRDKSDRAPESIMRLSKILRFVLYETGSDYISIEKELKIITDYIELEKLRYDETLQLNFNYDVEDMKQSIPPLLLMPLVENAFKHGVSETRGRPFIDIHLTVNQRQLTFVVKNSTENAGETEVRENIGLSNLRRQLQLLYTDHSLKIEQPDHSFVATLKINLSSHV